MSETLFPFAETVPLRRALISYRGADQHSRARICLCLLLNQKEQSIIKSITLRETFEIVLRTKTASAHLAAANPPRMKMPPNCLPKIKFPQ